MYNMGNLINPLSRILGFRNNLFWGNNFSFYYCRFVYRQQNFKIKCFQKLFKFIFRFLFDIFDIPRAHYSLSLNFIGQANSILNILCDIHNLSGYNIGILLLLIDDINLPEVTPSAKFRFGSKSIKSRLKNSFDFLKARIEKTFEDWRFILAESFIQKVDKDLDIKKIKLIDGNNIKKYGKMRVVFKYCESFAYEKRTQVSLVYKKLYNRNYLKSFFDSKFKIVSSFLKILGLMGTSLFINIFIFLFRTFYTKVSYDFNIRKFKFKFKSIKVRAGAIVRNVNHFCYLALRKGYRINYVIKMVRYSVRFLKIVRGFQMIVSGRFYRRGRAMFKISSFGDVGSQSGKGFLMYRNSERVKEYGMCSIKLLFFFRRILKFMGKIPLRSKWFHYLKFLRANYKVRNQFGYIKY